MTFSSTPGDPAQQRHAAATAQRGRAFVEALRPRRASEPVVAILALNDGTEITDFLLPHAVLRRADLADVQAVALHQGRVSLYPALHVEVAHDLTSFDRAYPAGADYVVVPAMREDSDPEVIAWLKQQAERGARIIGVCAGGGRGTGRPP